VCTFRRSTGVLESLLKKVGRAEAFSSSAVWLLTADAKTVILSAIVKSPCLKSWEDVLEWRKPSSWYDNEWDIHLR
jgi:hypothetical protein